MSSSYDGAKRDLLDSLLDGYAQKIYVEAWKGVGATALLREVAEEVEAWEKREFDVVIKVAPPAPFQDPWKIQRAVARQLNLPSAVTTVLDEAEEDDDFFGGEVVSSKDVMWKVMKETEQAVEGRSVLLVLRNNLAEGRLIGSADLGISIGRRFRNAVLWTSGMNIRREAASASADSIVRIEPPDEEAALYLVYKEAVEIARYIDESSGGSLRTTPLIVLRCFWYCLLLLRRAAFNQSILLPDGGRPLEAAVRYFVCDGILQGDDAASWEIGKAVAPVIGPMVNDQLLQYWEEELTSSTWTPRGERERVVASENFIDQLYPTGILRKVIIAIIIIGGE